MNKTVYAKNGTVFYNGSGETVVGPFRFTDKLITAVGKDAVNAYAERVARVWNSRVDGGEEWGSVLVDLTNQYKAASVRRLAKTSVEDAIVALNSIFVE